MKSNLLSFIELKCKDESKPNHSKFCGNWEIWQFEQENKMSRTECQDLLRELHKEKKIEFGRTINGYYIRRIIKK